MTKTRLLRSALGLLLFVACFTLSTGCGSKVSPLIKGMVTCDGQPVTFGQVVFYSGPIVRAIVQIGPDGAFNIGDLPALEDGEEYKVAITTTVPVSPDQIGAIPKGTNPTEKLPSKMIPHYGEANAKKGAGGPGDKADKAGPPHGGGNTPPKPPPPPVPMGPNGPIENVNKKPVPMPKMEPKSTVMPLPSWTPEEKKTMDAIQAKYGDPKKAELTYSKSTGLTFNIELTVVGADTADK